MKSAQQEEALEGEVTVREGQVVAIEEIVLEKGAFITLYGITRGDDGGITCFISYADERDDSETYGKTVEEAIPEFVQPDVRARFIVAFRMNVLTERSLRACLGKKYEVTFQK